MVIAGRWTGGAHWSTFRSRIDMGQSIVTRRLARTAAGIFLAALATFACGERDKTGTNDDKLLERLDAIEERLGIVEKRIESLSDVAAGLKGLPRPEAAEG